jgi:hypothetical protein
VYVEFRENLTPEEIEAFIKERVYFGRGRSGHPAKPSLNSALFRPALAGLPEGAHIEESIDHNDDERACLASLVYHRADLLPTKTGLTFTDFLLVRFKPRAEKNEVTKLIRDIGVEEATSELDLLGEDLHRIRIREPKQTHALEVAGKFRQSQLVKHSDPDWTQLHSAISATIPNDSLWANQWNMTIIDAPDGWDLTGANTVVIAIPDTGCDLNHQDLSAKYVPVADRRDSVAMTNTPEDDYGHGRVGAGIAQPNQTTTRGRRGRMELPDHANPDDAERFHCL